MKAALYLRVSSKEQHTENQLLPLEEFCKQRGFEIVKVYAENESAWQAGHQHEWAQLMHGAKSRHFNVVVVWAVGSGDAPWCQFSISSDTSIAPVQRQSDIGSGTMAGGAQ